MKKVRYGKNIPEYPNAHTYATSSVTRATASVLGNNASVTDHAYDFRGWAPRAYPTLDSAGRKQVFHVFMEVSIICLLLRLVWN